MCERDLLSFELAVQAFDGFDHFVLDGVVKEMLRFVDGVLKVLHAFLRGLLMFQKVDLFAVCHCRRLYRFAANLQRDKSRNSGDARQAHRDAQLPCLMLTVLGDRNSFPVSVKCVALR